MNRKRVSAGKPTRKRRAKRQRLPYQVHKASAIAFATLVCLCHVCVAQTQSPPVPAALFVPDRFARAAKQQSSAPYYVMVTVVNDTTGEKKTVCLESVPLFEAMRTEHQLGWGQDYYKILHLLLDNPDRTYHFTNPDAWKQVQPRYSPETLAAVEEEFRPLTTAQLAERFNYDKTQGILKMDPKWSDQKIYDYGAAAAYVLTERGLLAGRSDSGNSLYVVTPRMVAEDEQLRQRHAAQTRRSLAEGRAYAAHLPGYSTLTRQYRVSQPDVMSGWSTFRFSAALIPTSPRLITSFSWENPVNEKTRKARYNWNQFLPLAAHVERLARQHPWLHAWKETGPDRTIEAQIDGRKLYSVLDDDFKKDIVPAWKDAGLKGKPYCQLSLHWQERGERAGATLYLPLPGSEEGRSLLTDSYPPPHAALALPGAHWLDKLKFHSFAIAKDRKAIIVTPQGEWRLLTFPPRRATHQNTGG